MNIHYIYRKIAIVPLILWGAISLFSCGSSKKLEGLDDNLKVSRRNMVTERSEDIVVIMSKVGRPSYRFSTPLIEGYSNAREPYREFKKGIKIITYQDDSLSTTDAILVANYAIYYEKSELWEAKGDVVVDKSDGRTLSSQQLFWDTKSKLIYSNVETKIFDRSTNDTFIGEGFESDEAMDKWQFRRLKGRISFEVQETSDESHATSELPSKSAARDIDTLSEEEKEASTSQKGEQKGAEGSKKTSSTNLREQNRLNQRRQARGEMPELTDMPPAHTTPHTHIDFSADEPAQRGAARRTQIESISHE